MLWMIVIVVVVHTDVDGWLVSEGCTKREVLLHLPVGFVAIVFGVQRNLDAAATPKQEMWL